MHDLAMQLVRCDYDQSFITVAFGLRSANLMRLSRSVDHLQVNPLQVPRGAKMKEFEHGDCNSNTTLSRVDLDLEEGGLASERSS